MKYFLTSFNLKIIHSHSAYSLHFFGSNFRTSSPPWQSSIDVSLLHMVVARSTCLKKLQKRTTRSILFCFDVYLFNLESKHHAGLQVLCDVAVRHPFTRIRHLNKNLDRVAVLNKSSIFPYKIVIWFSVR